ncbi:Fusaric acid resistance protein family protein [Legionella gratiana]|uniref:Fusaric acid resistance protein family protein n=1 Tax=Legionella gratiana TaxID=45066 RepID=A0A378JES8_9GAMM|nr:FUSC family protein [Legionella gratiana]KTD12053.1 Fusaric acid resistance protein family protein [Legionella gratiana]STX46343.1 Predicted membrane protein [Legionella gratiana]
MILSRRNNYIDSLRITISLFLPIVLAASLNQLDKGLIIGFSSFLNGICGVGENNWQRFYATLSAGMLITCTTVLGSLFAPTSSIILVLFGISLFIAGLVVHLKNEAISIVTYFGAVGWLIGSSMHAGGMSSQSLFLLWIAGVILSLLFLIISFPIQSQEMMHQKKSKHKIDLWQFDGIIYAFELASLGILCTAIAFHINPQHGIWATATALAVLHPEHNTRWLRIIYRMIGTLIGVALTIIFVHLLQQSIYLLLFAACCSLIALIMRKQHYGIFMVFVTPMIIIVAGINSPAIIPLAEERALYTGMGIGFAALFTLVMSLRFWRKNSHIDNEAYINIDSN